MSLPTVQFPPIADIPLAARISSDPGGGVVIVNVVMLAYPDMTQLDLTGPFEVFARFKELQIHLVWKTVDAIVDASGLRLLPSTSFAGCPQADILFVPGGPGQVALMEDDETLDFLRAQAAGARYVTSVCTGSLLLGAAGLLHGYAATCHWLSLPQLGHFGAAPISRRVVVDRNRITGAGVTSGIDFALELVGQVFGEERAKLVQLAIEYDPEPPFEGGSPGRSEPDLVKRVRAVAATMQEHREMVGRRAAARLLR